MIRIHRSDERGFADHGWLKAFHTFSFADYYDPKFVNFSVLRVLNQDRVAPGRGFPKHGHDNMEIVSVVLDGVMEHKDSLGNGSQMRPGDIQFMSAGTGVTHSEFNASATEELHLLQMWVIPAKRGYEPRYAQKHFPESERRGTFKLVVSPDGRDGSLSIGQDAHLYAGLLDGNEHAKHSLTKARCAWMHVAQGRLTLNEMDLGTGDGAAILDEPEIRIAQGQNAEFVLWDLPAGH